MYLFTVDILDVNKIFVISPMKLLHINLCKQLDNLNYALGYLPIHSAYIKPNLNTVDYCKQKL